jgi:hypothetical protein
MRLRLQLRLRLRLLPNIYQVHRAHLIAAAVVEPEPEPHSIILLGSEPRRDTAPALAVIFIRNLKNFNLKFKKVLKNCF